MPTAAGSVQALISYLEHDATPMIVLDVEYNILAANTAYQRQFATPRQQVQGQKCFRVSHQYSVPCDQAGEHCPMKQALATRAPDRVLHIHHTPRGPEHVDVELRPILDEGGQVIAYVERLSRVVTASAQPRESGLVGRSESFNAALSALQRAAPSQIPVLLQGESGTGKELFARALHTASPRAGGPLVVVDCTGLSETLFESELFGHERGAFTGAMQRKIGLAETAHGGTLFLDEIGDLPLAMQAKLLRVVQERQVRALGAVQEDNIDVRLVSATHKDLAAEVKSGRFRQDLFYRLNVIEVRMPALRERREDLPQLVQALLRRICTESGQHLPLVDPLAQDWLNHHPLPGNVRELENLLHRALALCDGQIITLNDLSDGAGDWNDTPAPDAPPAASEEVLPESAGPPAAAPSDLQAFLDQQEREVLVRALREANYNRTLAATRLGLNLRQIRYRIQRLHIPMPKDAVDHDD